MFRRGGAGIEIGGTSNAAPDAWLPQSNLALESPLGVPRAGFEPAAYPLGGDRSIQLSYRGSGGFSLTGEICGEEVAMCAPRVRISEP